MHKASVYVFAQTLLTCKLSVRLLVSTQFCSRQISKTTTTRRNLTATTRDTLSNERTRTVFSIFLRFVGYMRLSSSAFSTELNHVVDCTRQEGRHCQHGTRSSCHHSVRTIYTQYELIIGGVCMSEHTFNPCSNPTVGKQCTLCLLVAQFCIIYGRSVGNGQRNERNEICSGRARTKEIWAICLQISTRARVCECGETCREPHKQSMFLTNGLFE